MNNPVGKKVRIRPSATVPGWWYACHVYNLTFTHKDGTTQAPCRGCGGAWGKTPLEAFNKLKECANELAMLRHRNVYLLSR